MKKWVCFFAGLSMLAFSGSSGAAGPWVPDAAARQSQQATVGSSPCNDLVNDAGGRVGNDSLSRSPAVAGRKAAVPHRLLSCNIRVSTLEEDARKGYGWEVRKKICLQVIRDRRPDLICMQEVVPQSYNELAASLKAYGSSGFAGPDMDRYPEGYHGIAKNVIFYRKQRYELVASGTYWLSDKPLLAGSASWGTARPRQCNWVRLRDRRTGCEFRVVNLHLDHKSSEARRRQMAVVLDECAQYAAGFPQLLAGDFNSTLADAPVQNALQAGWSELYLVMHGGRDSGYTYHAFLGENYPHPERGRIDFIFSRGSVRPVSADRVLDRPCGLYPSDHYFLQADLLIP